jgi:hypothetical protein
MGLAVHIPDRRALHEDRAHDIVITVQIAVSDNLYIQHIGSALGYYGGYILEYTGSETCLQQQHVIQSLPCLDNTQIINPTVGIQIQIVDHVAARVDNLFELSGAA